MKEAHPVMLCRELAALVLRGGSYAERLRIIERLMDATNGLLGHLQLIGGRDDLPAEIAEVLQSGHRVEEAHAAVDEALAALSKNSNAADLGDAVSQRGRAPEASGSADVGVPWAGEARAHLVSDEGWKDFCAAERQSPLGVLPQSPSIEGALMEDIDRQRQKIHVMADALKVARAELENHKSVPGVAEHVLPCIDEALSFVPPEGNSQVNSEPK